MTLSVIKVASGGLAVTQAPAGFGYPCVLSPSTFGIAITPVASGGRPITDATVGGGIFSGIQLSNTSFPAGSITGVAIGTFSVSGGTGTYTFTLTNNAGSKAQVAGTNGVNLQTGATLATAGSFSITVHADNGAGSTFDQTFLITAILVFNTVVPAVTGTTQVGSTLVSTSGTWSGAPSITFAYQWRRNGVNIGSATLNSYLLVVADYGTSITCAVTASNPGGSATAISNSVGPITAILPANAGGAALPVISGITDVGQTLSTTVGTWTGTLPVTFTYQWLRNGSAIAGATAVTYLLVTADGATNISVMVTGTNLAGSANATAAAVGPINAPLIIGATVLSWTSDASDNAPNYSVDLPSDIANGDVVYLEEADNSGFTGSILDTTDIGPLSGDPIAMESVPVTNGIWYARARIKRGSSYGPYSNVVTVTIGIGRQYVIAPLYVNTIGSRQYITVAGYVVE